MFKGIKATKTFVYVNPDDNQKANQSTCRSLNKQ